MGSRISRSKNQLAVKRAILLSGITVVGILFFIFILLPLTVRLFQIIPRSGTTPGLQQSLPPQRPVINPLPEFTSSDSMEVSGFTQPDTTVSLVVNGSFVDDILIQDSSEFLFSNVRLLSGQNRVYVVAENSSNLTAQSSEYIVVFDNEPPLLEISSPADNEVVRSRRDQSVSFSGTTEPNVRLSVNERLIFVEGNGSFTGTFQLNEGENTLIFLAIDEAGNQTSVTRIVRFEPN